MDLSVVICTWNRADMLADTLESLVGVVLPADCTWELLVVNNNCNDQTDSVLDGFASRLPLRKLREPCQGLSYARNRGASAARGEVIVFTDDDMRFDRHWLSAYLDAARRWPESLAFGGWIEPRYETTPPRWVVRNVDVLFGLLGIRAFAQDEGPFPPTEYPYGANMAFRREVFTRWLFDHRLGLNGSSQIQTEEGDLIIRIGNAGYPPIWVPTAKVWHTIQKRQVTQQFVWKRFYGLGRTFARRNDYQWWLERNPVDLPACRPNHLRMLLRRLCGDTTWVPEYVTRAIAIGMRDELDAKAAGSQASDMPSPREGHGLAARDAGAELDTRDCRACGS